MLADFCELYNCALEHRLSAYAKGVKISHFDQMKALTIIRKDIPKYARWSSCAEGRVLRRLDQAYSAFFKRVKQGQKAGSIRFKSQARFNTANFLNKSGFNLRQNGKLSVQGVSGDIKVRWSRGLPAVFKSAILTRRTGKWYVIFHVDVEPVNLAGPLTVGIDIGLKSLAALSTGEIIQRERFTRKHAAELRRAQRKVARRKRGSGGHRKAKEAVARLHRRVADGRHDYLHKVSRSVVDRYGKIAVEDLNIKGLAGGMLAKEVYDAAWGKLVSMIAYKAENAGCELIKVDPRWTSQTCPECGIVAKKKLDERDHICHCGCNLDRDVAAAKIIHMRAFGAGSAPEALSQRVAA